MAYAEAGPCAPDENPYVGPRPFEAEDARFFFGRDAEVAGSLSRSSSRTSVVLLYAASGAGKSSLLNAARRPAARARRAVRGAPRRARPRAARRGSRGDAQRLRRAPSLSHLGAGGESSAELARATTSRERPRTPRRRRLPGAARARDRPVRGALHRVPGAVGGPAGFFERSRATALRDDPLLRVVLSIREDFLAQLDPYARLLPDGFRARYRLERLGREAALRAVRSPRAPPAARSPSGVAEQLVDDLLKVRLDTEHGTTRGRRTSSSSPCSCRSRATAFGGRCPSRRPRSRRSIAHASATSTRCSATSTTKRSPRLRPPARMREDSLRDRFAKTFITPMGTRGTVFWTPEAAGGIPPRAIEELDARHLIRAEHRAGARWYELTHDRLIEPIRASNRVTEQRRGQRRRRALMVAGGVLIGLTTAAAAAILVQISNSPTNETSDLGRVVTKAAPSVQRLHNNRPVSAASNRSHIQRLGALSSLSATRRPGRSTRMI